MAMFMCVLQTIGWVMALITVMMLGAVMAKAGNDVLDSYGRHLTVGKVLIVTVCILLGMAIIIGTPVGALIYWIYWIR